MLAISRIRTVWRAQAESVSSAINFPGVLDGMVPENRGHQDDPIQRSLRARRAADESL